MRVEVPAGAAAYVVGKVRRFQYDDPEYDADCPVCDQKIAAEPAVAVYVGVDPDDRRLDGMMRGSAVPVHAMCTNLDNAHADLLVFLRRLAGGWRARAKRIREDGLGGGEPLWDLGFASCLDQLAGDIERIVGKGDKGDRTDQEMVAADSHHADGSSGVRRWPFRQGL